MQFRRLLSLEGTRTCSLLSFGDPLVDAPLDDANIGRFIEMLRSMMDKTQFIIITHSRKTMEIARVQIGSQNLSRVLVVALMSGRVSADKRKAWNRTRTIPLELLVPSERLEPGA